MKRLKLNHVPSPATRRSSRNKPSEPVLSPYFRKLHTDSPDEVETRDDEDLGPRSTDNVFDSESLQDLAIDALSTLTAGEALAASDSQRMRRKFYDVPCEKLAQDMLGKVLVRRLENGTLLKGKIVETECYLGGEDKASMSYNNKMTERSKPMYMEPGTMFVYMTYGMYYMFNISSQGPGAAVLLRALEPLEGLDVMQYLRLNSRRQPKEPINIFSERLEQSSSSIRRHKPHELCNGPAKLCSSLAIDKTQCNGQDLTTWPGLWISDPDPNQDRVVVRTSRIGIESAGVEWASKPLRFYLLGNQAVSKRDKVAEKVAERW